MTIRIKNFKIGCVHGKSSAQEKDSEAQLRNELYMIGMLKIEKSKKETINIRLVAYEMPLQTGQSRVCCIDLFGYDENKKPWIIELKTETSGEIIEKNIEQIDGYGEMFEQTRDNVEREIQEKYHWKEFKFSQGIGKVILAGRIFFQNKELINYRELGIYCCSFSRIKDVVRDDKVSLLEINKGKGTVNLRIHNK